MKKVTFVMPQSLKNGRGTERTTLEYIKYADSKKFKIKVVEFDRYDKERLTEAEINEYIKNTNTEIITIPSFVDFASKIYDNSFYTIINNLIRKIPYKVKNYLNSREREIYNKIRDTDVVYLLDMRYAVLFDGMDIPIFGTMQQYDPIAFTISNTFIKRLYYKKMQSLYFKYVNSYHVFPKRHDLIKKMGYRNVLSLNSGIDPTLFFPQKIINDKFILLYVGTLSKFKGFDLLIDIWNKIKMRNDLEMHVVGQGPLQSKAESLTSENFYYHGRLTNEELSKLYGKCDIFIYPTRNDTFSLVTLEAMSSGAYCEVSNTLKGNFDDCEKLRYIEYLNNDTKSFISRLEYIITMGYKKTYEERLMQHKYITENYSWKNISNEFWAYIENL